MDNTLNVFSITDFLKAVTLTSDFNEEKNTEKDDTFTSDYSNLDYEEPISGDIGEKYVLDLLENEKKMNRNISNIEWVANTKAKTDSPGYDIEVKLCDNSLIGIEVKSTVLNGTNINITNNEINAAIKLRERFYLVIIIFDKETKEKAKTLYLIKNIIDAFEIDSSKLFNFLKSEEFGNIILYPQVFKFTMPLKILKSYAFNPKDSFFPLDFQL